MCVVVVIIVVVEVHAFGADVTIRCFDTKEFISVLILVEAVDRSEDVGSANER